MNQIPLALGFRETGQLLGVMPRKQVPEASSQLDKVLLTTAPNRTKAIHHQYFHCLRQISLRGSVGLRAEDSRNGVQI